MWLQIEISPHEDAYDESLPLIYYKEANVLVSMVRNVVETPQKMGGSWNDNDKKNVKNHDRIIQRNDDKPSPMV
jgi:hypothetical protein